MYHKFIYVVIFFLQTKPKQDTVTHPTSPALRPLAKQRCRDLGPTQQEGYLTREFL
jgi:hypothetical protein